MPTDPDVNDALRRRAATAARIGALQLDPNVAYALGANSADEAILAWMEHPHRWQPPVTALMETHNDELLQRVIQFADEAAAKAILANPHCRNARMLARGLTSSASPRVGTREQVLNCRDAHPLADALERRSGLLDDAEVLAHAVNVALRSGEYGGPVGRLITPNHLEGRNRSHPAWAARTEFLGANAPELLNCPLRDLPWRITGKPFPAAQWPELAVFWPESLFERSQRPWTVDVQDRSQIHELLASLAVAPRDLAETAMANLDPRTLVHLLEQNPAFRALCPQATVDAIQPEAL